MTTLSKPAAFLIAIPLVAVLAAPIMVGDLNPPPGPVTGTMKPLSQVEPRTPIETLPSGPSATRVISQPGSYYLTGNLVVFGGTLSGIEIAASFVSLDLCGFSILGNGSSGSGIAVSGSNRTNLVIRNGTIGGWGGNGINGSNAVNSQVEVVCTSANSQNGILMGSTCLVRACTSRGNTLSGIAVSQGSLVSQCAVALNFGAGISLSGSGAQAVHCTANDNAGRGIVGAADGASVIECNVHDNDNSGIEVNTNSMVLRNTCHRNGNAIHASIYVIGGGNRIEGNTVSGSVRGLEVDAGGNLIIQNSAANNATDYDIVGTQTIGPILVGGGTIASENPWANFEL